ncbi:hypothetical protein H4R33_003285, partial [Dimargaris cristalligena]
VYHPTLSALELIGHIRYLTTHDAQGHIVSSSFKAPTDPFTRPRIVKVGYSDVRYVTPEHLGPWVIDMGPRESFPTNGTSTTISTTGYPTNRYVIPRAWRDIQGHCIDYVYLNCLQATLHVIAKAPGITRESIHRRLNVALSPIELDDILVDLQARLLIQVAYLRVPSRPTPFSRTRQWRVGPDQQLCPGSTECFTTAPNYISNMASLSLEGFSPA